MKNKIKIGDKITIKNPQIFDRCGYPMSLEFATKEVEKLHEEEINKILSNYITYDARFYKSKAYKEIVKGLALAYLKHNNYGGMSRSVHTTLLEPYRNKIAKVVDITYCKSGDYIHGGGDYDDYSPPYLANQKSHRILECYLTYEDNNSSDNIFPYTVFKIEDINIEKYVV